MKTFSLKNILKILDKLALLLYNEGVKNNKEVLKTMMHDVDYLFSLLVELELFTEDELRLVTYINGYNLESLEDCLYARYGYRNIEQFLGELNREEE